MGVDGRVEVVAMPGTSGADVRWGRPSGHAMIRQALWDDDGKADAQYRGTSDAAMCGPSLQEVSP
jgi:hypothetical protein